jgi:DNA-binding transcriptional LysR family regulator
MVAREENITKAAQLLHISQPTLSRQLAQLEEELGIELFERRSHSIVLTEDGMFFRRRAQEVVDLADKTKKDLSHKGNVIAGEIAIGCGELLSMADLIDILTAFREQYPLVHYNVYSASNESITQRIEQGTLDIGLLIEPVSVEKYDFVRMHTKEEWGVLVRKDSELAKKDFIRPEDLINLPLISTRNSLTHNEIISWFGDYAQQINIVSTYNLLYNSAIMVQRGMGIALVLKLESNYDDLCFVPVSPKLEMSSVLAWKAQQVFSPTVKAFIRFAKHHIKGIS